jgi:hypothetical protein
VVLTLRECGDLGLGYRREGEPVVVNPAPTAMVLVDDATDLVVLTRRALV